MSQINWESFTKKIAIKADMQVLYDAWAIPSEIEKWFLSEAKYENRAGEIVGRDVSVQQNDIYFWSWFLYDIVESGTILQANGRDHLRFTFAGSCEVEIQLTQDGDSVVVTLTQSLIPTDDDSKKSIRLGCDSGWSFYLVNLKSIYEGGIDLRNKDEALRGMLNN